MRLLKLRCCPQKLPVQSPPVVRWLRPVGLFSGLNGRRTQLMDVTNSSSNEQSFFFTRNGRITEESDIDQESCRWGCRCRSQTTRSAAVFSESTDQLLPSRLWSMSGKAPASANRREFCCLNKNLFQVHLLIDVIYIDWIKISFEVDLLIDVISVVLNENLLSGELTHRRDFYCLNKNLFRRELNEWRDFCCLNRNLVGGELNDWSDFYCMNRNLFGGELTDRRGFCCWIKVCFKVSLLTGSYLCGPVFANLCRVTFCVQFLQH